MMPSVISWIVPSSRMTTARDVHPCTTSFWTNFTAMNARYNSIARLEQSANGANALNVGIRVAANLELKSRVALGAVIRDALRHRLGRFLRDGAIQTEVIAVKRRIEDPLGFEWSKGNITELSPTVGYVDTVVGNNNLVVHQLLERQAGVVHVV